MEFEIYGDSIRAGYGLKDQVYLENLPGFDVKNHAFNGATVFDILEEVYKDLDFKNSYALVGVGVNDLIYGRDPERIFERLMDITKRLKSLGRRVIIEAILPVKKKYFLSLYNFSEEEINEKISILNDLLEGYQEEYGYSFLAYDFSKEDLKTRDGLHPNDEGNLQLRRQFLKFIEDIK